MGKCLNDSSVTDTIAELFLITIKWTGSLTLCFHEFKCWQVGFIYIFTHCQVQKNSLWDLEGQEQKCIEMEILK